MSYRHNFLVFKQFKDTMIVYYACIFLFDFTCCHAICLLREAPWSSG